MNQAQLSITNLTWDGVPRVELLGDWDGINRVEAFLASTPQELRLTAPAVLLPAGLSQQFARLECVAAGLRAADSDSSAAKEIEESVQEIGLWLRTSFQPPSSGFLA